ncbi:MAG: histidine kinase [Ferruginibacter sp.]
MSILKYMKPLSYSTKEFLIMVIIMPPIALVLNYFLFGPAYFMDGRTFSLATLLTLAVLVLVYISCGMVAVVLLNRFPKYHQAIKRIGLSLVAYVIIMVAAITIIFLGYDYIGFLGYEINWHTYFKVLLVGFTCNVLATSLNEGAAFYEKWRVMVDEAENLKKENLQSQLEGLKGQVNPHFLFNSLNSLSSLIADEPEKAEKFLDEMSKVYRYLLRSNEEGLATLETELQFINSYFHMLKTRYGDGLDMEIRVNEQYLNHLLPPLTLQMLVENAVKHNMILKDSPLQILIMTTHNGKLIVSNNLQKKLNNVMSNKVGLHNITKKYELMREDEITIQDDGKEFSVAVPLIQPRHLPVH